MHATRLNPDVSVIHDALEVPGLGFLPVNAFVLHAEQPLVVDTGVGLPDRHFLDVLADVIAPEDVRWIYLTHPDRDHTGGIFDLLEAAPDARLITTFVGAGIMSVETPLPMPRLYFLNAGQSLDLGDREVTAFRPPLFDNAATLGLYDSKSGTLFSSDCFGAPLASEADALADDASVVGAELAQRQALWTSVDSPWVHTADPMRFGATLEPIRRFDPTVILSTHLPPAIGRTSEFLATAAQAPGTDPFVGPDQAALEAMLAQFEPV
ncbi:MAG TPA: MBL fold metallo-hydrolase [Jatrophihabitantaceae bacterium]|nr:MBL fold metallo-hydrolase [Jatrophihabitantaceae bacterium]